MSKHGPIDHRCLAVRLLDASNPAKPLVLVDDQKLTLLKGCIFLDAGHDIPVYASARKKNSAAKVLKLLRKNENKPAVAVDDDLGLMAVLVSISAVKLLAAYDPLSHQECFDDDTGGYFRHADRGYLQFDQRRQQQ